MLFALRKFKLKKKNNIAAFFANGVLPVLCNFQVNLETRIDGIISYTDSKCSLIRKSVTRNFKELFAMFNMKQFSDTYFKELFTSIETDKQIEQNFSVKQNTISVTKTTVIT